MSANPNQRSGSTSLLGYLPFVLAVLMIIALGIYQGLHSDRWGDKMRESLAMKKLLEQVPSEIGDWVGVDVQQNKQSLALLDQAGAVGFVIRDYQHKQTGEKVQLYLVCGHQHDMAIHTPSVCYPAAGFEALLPAGTAPKQLKYGDEETAQFHNNIFRRETADRGIEQLLIYWAWGHESEWLASDNPRSDFSRLSGIYKMYLTRRLDDSSTVTGDNPCLQFGQELLPVLEPLLFPEVTPESETTATAQVE